MIQYSTLLKDRCTFNNRIAERLIIICSFERFHSKQLEYTTKDHIATCTYFENHGTIL